jgi:hypothetical protein
MRYITGIAARPFRPSQESVLSSINDARTVLSLPPLPTLPAGRMGSPRQCPLASCLDSMVGVDGARFESKEVAERIGKVWNTPVRQDSTGTYVVLLPSSLRRFVRDYDLGAYPRLEA